MAKKKDRQYLTESEARTAFDKAQYRRSHRATFDELLNVFREDCTNFTHIGKELGISREMVRRVYQRFFAGYLPRRPNGNTRRVVCTRKRHSQMVRTSLENDARLVHLFQKCLEKGINVDPVRSKNGLRHNSRLIKLNGHVCKLLVGSEFNGYYRFQVTNKKYDFLILQVQNGEEFLVIPASILNQSRVYIPTRLGRSSYHKKSAVKVEWLDYLEAWHLLKPTGPNA